MCETCSLAPHHTLDNAFAFVENPITDHRQESVTRQGQHQLSRHSLEQVHTKVLLQRLDLVTDCGLGDAQLGRCARKAQVTAGGFKGSGAVQGGRRRGILSVDLY